MPVAGAELLTNGDFEAWTDANTAAGMDFWTNGTRTLNREATIVHSGTYAANVSPGAGENTFQISMRSLTDKAWIIFTYYSTVSDNSQGVRGYPGAYTMPTLFPGLAWTGITQTARLQGTVLALTDNGWVAGAEIYFDDASLKYLSLSSLLSTRAYASPDCDLSVAVTRTANTQAGLCARLDSAASPANFIIAYQDGANNVKVDKCVAGVYTNIIDGAVTYAAGRVLRLVCSGNDVSCYYNGAQVGSTVTVSDAGIVSNKNHGLFSTYAANTFTGYTAA